MIDYSVGIGKVTEVPLREPSCLGLGFTPEKDGAFGAAGVGELLGEPRRRGGN